MPVEFSKWIGDFKNLGEYFTKSPQNLFITPPISTRNIQMKRNNQDLLTEFSPDLLLLLNGDRRHVCLKKHVWLHILHTSFEVLLD